jgi:hypothetical protein
MHRRYWRFVLVQRNMYLQWYEERLTLYLFRLIGLSRSPVPLAPLRAVPFRNG